MLGGAAAGEIEELGVAAQEAGGGVEDGVVLRHDLSVDPVRDTCLSLCLGLFGR
jgi:hypothetical protein